jgi:SAM-dependent methyltransferase
MVAKQILYPEVAVGGYTRADGTVEFYLRLGELVRADSVVVDLGAGRGAVHQDRSGSVHARLSNFRGRCARVIGVDVASAVHENPSLDEAYVLEGPDLPLPDASADVIFCDWVLEHIEDPQGFVAEISRVLKPAGWFCARTPNRWGYIGLATNLVPNALHVQVLSRAQPGRKEMDVFPTHYRLNTAAAIRRSFPSPTWSAVCYGHFPEPAYFGTSVFLWRGAQMMSRLTPPGMEPVLLIFAQKR